MIYITGDLHGGYDVHKLLKKDFNEDDFLIVCGDFGYVWTVDSMKYELEKEELDSLMKRIKCTVLFCDGNHENFARLDALPKQKLFGGTVQKVTDKCYHVCRGEVLTINGKKFLFIGGAESHDKQYRTEGISWWKEESITKADMNRALKNADKYKVDYIISHCAPLSIRNKVFINENIPYSDYEEAQSCELLELLYAKMMEKRHKWKWFLGHYHLDVNYNPFNLLYNYIYKLED